MADGHFQSNLPLVDGFGRRVSYLRLSVTDRCDMRCTYCMSEDMNFLPKADLLSVDEMVQVSDAFIQRGVRKIRVTGGEPLVRKDIMELFSRLGDRLGSGLDELTLTTNASQLSRYAEELRRIGVKRINVSLDSIDPDSFAQITRRGSLAQVMDGLDAADAAGLKIKINTVALKHDNADQIPDMVAWAHGRGFDITLIEVMPMGESGPDRFDQYISLFDVRDDLEQRWTLEDEVQSDLNAGPSRYARVRETGGRVGFITPLTNNFCAGCNRMRLTCTGRIYMCLGQEDHVDLRAALRETDHPKIALDAALDRALGAKPEKHDFAIDRRGQSPAVPRHMSVTGG